MTSARHHRQDHDLETAMDDGALAPSDRPRTSEAAGRIESNAQLAGVVQRKTDSAEEGGDLNGEVASRIASEKGGGSSLPEPVRERMEERFGQDFSEVRVHTDGASAELNQQLSARAFTTGRDIFLGPDASVADDQLIAHELTHVVQQGGEDTAPTTVGAAETSAEQAAESAAGQVAVTQSEETAEEETDETAEEQSADQSEQIEETPEEEVEEESSEASEVQRYTDDKKVSGQYARVSENGHVVVLGQSNFSQDLYASAAMIDNANAKLEASGEEGSYLRLVRTGDALEHAGKSLEKVAPVFTSQGDAANAALEKKNKGKDEGDKMALWADCGRSSRTVMGSHADASPHATYNSEGKQKDTDASSNPATYSEQIYLECMPQFMAHPSSAQFLKAGVHYSGSKDNLIQPDDATHARTQYWELGEDGRRAFDQMAGINSAANPEIGGAYTLNTEGDMPGFKTMGDMTWNFHWAGCVMKDGTDNITLENYADGKGYESINTDWNFQMYGTVKKGQTFLDEHLASNTHGNRGSAFAIEPEGS